MRSPIRSTKIVTGFDDTRFKSLICVPIYARDGHGIGVIFAALRHRASSRPKEVDFLASTGASLVAGAIENARLYEETRQRVHELEELTRLGEEIAQAGRLWKSFSLRWGVRTLPTCSLRGACHLYLLDPAADELRATSLDAEAGTEAPHTLRAHGAARSAGRRGGRSRCAARRQAKRCSA